MPKMTRMIIDVAAPKRLSRAQPVRRLHRGHFAFMRALIQGMDERAAWARYLLEEGQSADIRQVRSTILWIKDTFAAAARRERRPGTARLIRLDPDRFTQKAAPKLPTLEEFALAQGLEDFSQEEQIEAYVAAYPQAAGRSSQGSKRGSGSSRRARVVERQLEALRWLEALVIHDPKPLDSVEAWLNPRLAARLRSKGILTLQDLAARMNHHGARWWCQLPGIGQHKARRLADWLEVHASALQMSITAYALEPQRQLSQAVRDSVVDAATALRPLEKFVLPTALDGRTGHNRARHAGEGGERSDLDAIRLWISSKAAVLPAKGTGLTATQRSYRKECERLLLWSALEARKPISDLSGEDLERFFSFLQSPPAHWCGPRSKPRWSPQWRPMEGPLSAAALRQSRVILHGLFEFLVKQDHLRANPCRLRLDEAPGRLASEAGGAAHDCVCEPTRSWMSVKHAGVDPVVTADRLGAAPLDNRASVSLGGPRASPGGHSTAS